MYLRIILFTNAKESFSLNLNYLGHTHTSQSVDILYMYIPKYLKKERYFKMGHSFIYAL